LFDASNIEPNWDYLSLAGWFAWAPKIAAIPSLPARHYS